MSQSPDKNAIRKDSYSNCFKRVAAEDLSVNVNDDEESSNSEKTEVIILVNQCWTILMDVVYVN